MEESDHAKFIKHLEESEEAVWSVAQWLQGKGYLVSVAPMSKSKNGKEMKDHVDNGDLFINQRVEVKRLGVNFTNADDWPFGDKFIVCGKNAFDRAIPKPYAYIILSNDKKRAAIVMADSSSNWTVEKRKDSRYESVIQDFYFCPKNLVSFVGI